MFLPPKKKKFTWWPLNLKIAEEKKLTRNPSVMAMNNEEPRAKSQPHGGRGKCGIRKTPYPSATHWGPSEVMDVSSSSMRGILSQCICISNHHFVHIKYLTILLVYYTSKNLKKQKHIRQYNVYNFWWETFILLLLFS